MVVDDKQNIVESDRVIYTPSVFARSPLFYVQEVGTLRSLKPHLSLRQGLESFLFLLYFPEVVHFITEMMNGCKRTED